MTGGNGIRRRPRNPGPCVDPQWRTVSLAPVGGDQRSVEGDPLRADPRTATVSRRAHAGVTRLAITLSILTAGQVGLATRPVLAADPPAAAPRLTVLVPGSYTGARFSSASRDGAHVFVQTAATLGPDPSNPYLKLYDVIAQRFQPLGSHVYYEASTPDGEFVLYETTEGLVAEDVDGWTDLYLHGSAGDRLVSVGTNSDRMDGLYVADDGTSAVFSTTEALLPADSDTKTDLYRWSAATGGLTLVTPGVPFVPTLVGASADGSRLFVEVYEDYLGLGQTNNIFESTPTGLVPFGDGAVRRISEDGSRVFFETRTSYVPGDQDDDWDGYEWSASGYRLLSSPSDGYTSLIDVQDSGEKWVLQSPAALSSDDTNSKWDVFLDSALGPQLVSRGSSDAFFHLANPSMTSITYYTGASLVPEDTDQQQDIYRWDAANPDAPQLVSSGDQLGSPEVVAINDAGDVVILETNERVTSEDTDMYSDVYRWTPSGTTLLSPDSGSSVTFSGASGDVQRVFMETSSKMDPADTNGSMDVYVSDLDVIPPVPTIEVPPDSEDSDATITVGAEGNDAVWFDCQLDGGPWEPCDITSTYKGLAAGPHVAAVHGYDAAANRSVEPAVATWTILGEGGPTDTTPPSGTISVASGATYATSSYVSVSVAATDAGSGLARVALSNDGSTWFQSGYEPRKSWSLDPGNGTRTVWAKWRDTAGNWSQAATDTIIADTSPPAIALRTPAVVPFGALGAVGTVPVKISWSATDLGTGIARYELGHSIDGAAWATAATNLTTTSSTRTLTTGHTHAFRVRAVDIAGNAGGWRSVGPFTATLLGEITSRATYAGSWSSISSSAFTDGRARRTSAAGARVTYSFTGSAVAWVATKGPTGGSVKVYADGSFVTTVDLRRTSTLNRQVVFSRSWTTPGPHTITLVNVGTAGHPYANVDGFISFDRLSRGAIRTSR